MSINNNAFTYGLTSSTEPSTARRGDISSKSSNDKGKNATYFCDDNNNNINIENLTINIDFINCYFNNNR